MRKAQLKFICDKDNAMPRVKETAHLLAKLSQQPVSAITTFSTILFHLLSVEIKQRKAGGQTEPQKRSTVLSQVR